MELALPFIQDLAVVLVLAFLAGIVSFRLNQSVILGYLLGGALVGPYALKIVYNVDTINLLAELGVILLMFSIGLEFNLKRLRRVGGIAIFAGGVGMLAMLLLGNSLGGLLGWSSTDSIFLGAILSVSSTAIIGKVLADMRLIERPHAQIILGILVVEDIGAIVLLTVVSSISLLGLPPLSSILIALLRVSLFFVTALIFGLKVFPRGMDWVRENVDSQEVLTLGALALCFAFAIFSYSLGFSVALGAFVMGAMLSESEYEEEIERSVRPIRDVFATLFFFSIGMLFDLSVLVKYPLVILAITLTALLGKVLSRGLATYLWRCDGVTAFCIGLGLIQIGEFSFVIARQGLDLGLISPILYQYTVAVAIITILLASPSIRYGPGIASYLDGVLPQGAKTFLRSSASLGRLAKRLLPLDVEAAGVARRQMHDIGINAFIVFLLWLLRWWVEGYVWKSSPSLLPLQTGFETASIVLVGALSIPSLYLIYRRAQELSDLILKIMAKRFELFGNIRLGAAMRNIALIPLLLVSVRVVPPLLLRDHQASTYLLWALLLGAIALCGYLFWHTISKFQMDLDRIIRDAILTDETVEKRRVDAATVVERMRKGKIVGQLMVTDEALVVGKSVAETNLRARTGVTILSIERGGTIISNPASSERLQPWDILILLGTDEERERAQQVLYGG